MATSARKRLRAVAAAALCAACTDVTLYATDGSARASVDRITIEGTLCAPIPDGKKYPVKALRNGTPVLACVELLDAQGKVVSQAAPIPAVIGH